jgi:hypothetical protein
MESSINLLYHQVSGFAGMYAVAAYKVYSAYGIFKKGVLKSIRKAPFSAQPADDVIVIFMPAWTAWYITKPFKYVFAGLSLCYHLKYLPGQGNQGCNTDLYNPHVF